MSIEKALKLCFAVFVGSLLGLLASIPCILWVYFMGFVSIYDCGYGDRCPPDLLIEWLLLGDLGGPLTIVIYPLGPIINFIFIGIIAGMIGGIIFHHRDQTPKNARRGGFFGILMGSGICAFLLSILLFINARDIIIFSAGISLLYLIVVVLIAGYIYRRIGSKGD